MHALDVESLRLNRPRICVTGCKDSAKINSKEKRRSIGEKFLRECSSYVYARRLHSTRSSSSLVSLFFLYFFHFYLRRTYAVFPTSIRYLQSVDKRNLVEVEWRDWVSTNFFPRCGQTLKVIWSNKENLSLNTSFQQISSTSSEGTNNYGTGYMCA